MIDNAYDCDQPADIMIQATGPALSTTAPNQTHFYTALDGSRSFRLLKFKEAIFLGRDPAALSFTLEHHDVDNCPPYLAVSYVWGKPYCKLDADKDADEPTLFYRHIEIDGSAFLISGNMWSALTHTLAHGNGTYIWLDGCCINQSNLAEREAQVLLMGPIYENAAEVVGFLGPLHPDLDSFHWLLMEVMSKLGELMVAGELLLEEQSLWTIRDMLKIDKGFFEASLVGAFRFYYSCRWFQRAWVKQEVMLAPSIRLICGRARLPFEGLSLAAIFFARSDWSLELFAYKHHSLYPHLRQDLPFRAFEDWRGLKQYSKDPEFATSFEADVLTPVWKVTSREQIDYAWLLEFVLSMRSSQCSDARDKIFATLGLAAKQCPNACANITPNYRAPAKVIYKKFMQLVAGHLGTLNFLIFVEPRTVASASDLPSWVPDFNVHYPYNGHKVITSVSTLFNDADPESLQVWRNLSFKADELHFHGIRIDRIQAVQREAQLERHPSFANLFSLLNLCAPCPPHNSEQSRIGVLWRTCIHDSYAAIGEREAHRPAPPEMAKWFRAYVLKALCEQVVGSGDDVSGLESFKDYLSVFELEIANGELPSLEMVMQGGEWFVKAGEEVVYGKEDPTEKTGDEGLDWIYWLKKAAHEWERAVARAQTSRNRRFRTEECRLGSAGPNIQAGDEIWLAPASSLPLVLRPLDAEGSQKYHFVSVAYVHGVMDNELFGEDSKLLNNMETVALG
jgi:hypothetical protein